VVVTKVERIDTGGLSFKDARDLGYRELGDLRDEFPVGRVTQLVSVEVDREPVERFLVERVGRGDYTDNPARAMRDEGAAVDEVTLARYAKQNRERHASRVNRQMGKVAKLPAQDQLVVLERQARERFVDVRDELRLARRYPHEAAKAASAIRAKLLPSAA
jgi:hypothetical protein